LKYRVRATATSEMDRTSASVTFRSDSLTLDGEQSQLGNYDGLGRVENMCRSDDPVPHLSLGQMDLPNNNFKWLFPKDEPAGSWRDPRPGRQNNHNYRNYYVDEYNSGTIPESGTCPDGR
jgi:hypothetical protein